MIYGDEDGMVGGGRVCDCRSGGGGVSGADGCGCKSDRKPPSSKIRVGQWEGVPRTSSRQLLEEQDQHRLVR